MPDSPDRMLSQQKSKRWHNMRLWRANIISPGGGGSSDGSRRAVAGKSTISRSPPGVDLHSKLRLGRIRRERGNEIETGALFSPNLRANFPALSGESRLL